MHEPPLHVIEEHFDATARRDMRRFQRQSVAAVLCTLYVAVVYLTSSHPGFAVVAGVLACGIFASYCTLRSWPAIASVLLLGGSVLVLPGLDVGSRGAARRMQCRNHLRQLSLAIMSYHDEHDAFPPPFTVDDQGDPLLSWRVLILPYLEQRALYERFRLDEPWNSPHNRPLAAEVPNLFRCPNSDARERTSYVAVVGEQTMWPTQKRITIADVEDGLSNTALVIELPDSYIVWTEPRDLDFQRLGRLLPADDKRSRQRWGHQGSIHVALADCSVQSLDDRQIMHPQLKGRFTRSGADRSPLEQH